MFVVRVSPDAFVQMAIQLAYYKVHGKCVATYESAQTRAFFHGRTENVRTLSTLSVAFCKTFEDKNATAEDKIAALTRAIAGHVAYMNEASAGSGIDRHLLALRLLAGAAGEKPALFDDPAFSRSMHFQLSTSNLTPAPEFFGGFGPMYLDGYGVAYALRPYGVRDFLFFRVWLTPVAVLVQRYRAHVLRADQRHASHCGASREPRRAAAPHGPGFLATLDHLIPHS